MLKIARKYRQIYVTQWYPSKFGRQDGPELEKNKHQHETIVRQIIPTRTGLNNIKSTCAVWLWSINGVQPIIEENVIIKDIPIDRRILESQSKSSYNYNLEYSTHQKIQKKKYLVNFNNDDLDYEVEVDENVVLSEVIV